MWFSRKQPGSVPEGAAKAAKPAKATEGAADSAPQPSGQGTTKSRGDTAESAARAALIKAGLRFVEANYRTPGRGGGEIDLIMRVADGTLVFVEVRQRADARHGGPAASIGSLKQQRIIFAARHYLMRFASPPPCRFDVVVVEGRLHAGRSVQVEWLQAAFDAS